MPTMPNTMLNRRNFLAATTTAFAGAALGGCMNGAGGSLASAGNTNAAGYGALVADPKGLLDLPAGFSYNIVSSFGDAMNDGFVVPDNADGMGCFAYDNDRVALVCNHELALRHEGRGPAAKTARIVEKAFDRDSKGQALPGGTSTMIYNLKTGKLEQHYLSLAGTNRNCAGGITPWGSWLTCEEDVSRAGDKGSQDHGWVFEVPSKHKGLVDPVPLKAMGRFNHEAAAVDPRTGIVYLTEDRGDGLFYRFLPNAKGELAKGGNLQALAFEDSAITDTTNKKSVALSHQKPMRVRWIDLDGVEAPDGDDLRKRGAAKGAALFARGEGIWMGDNALYFCCTSGGVAGFGQIMRYTPSAQEGQSGEASNPGLLDLFVESTGKAMLDFGDNLTVTPNGHLIVCEDQYTDVVDNRLRGVTPSGQVYDFGRLKQQTELAGACFSPDGSTFFVNAYSPGKTLAITGPWNHG